MQKQHTDFLTGLLIGIIAPIIGFYFFSKLGMKLEIDEAYKQLSSRNLLTYVGTINIVVTNAFVFFVFNKKNQWQKAKGVIGASLIYAIVILYIDFLQ